MMSDRLLSSNLERPTTVKCEATVCDTRVYIRSTGVC
jgi:hypothetical protein